MGIPRVRAAAAALAALLAACSTVSSRIKKHQAEFDASAPEVQKAIREKRVEVGFTPLQAEIALGKPDRSYVRQTATAVQSVWAYGDGGTSVGVGLGMGWGGGSSAYGLGVRAGEPIRHRGDRLLIVFQGEKVLPVERRPK